MAENNVVMYIYDNSPKPMDILHGVGYIVLLSRCTTWDRDLWEYSTTRDRLLCVLACVFGLLDSFETSCPRMTPPDVRARLHT